MVVKVRLFGEVDMSTVVVATAEAKEPLNHSSRAGLPNLQATLAHSPHLCL